MPDHDVCRATFTGLLHRSRSESEVAVLLTAYVGHLEDTVATSQTYRVLPGLPAALERLEGDGLLIGITSGNVETAAHIKLARGGLNRWFTFGGYGSDSPDRGELTRIAIGRGGRVLGGVLDPAAVLVVGDTPRRGCRARSRGGLRGRRDRPLHRRPAHGGWCRARPDHSRTAPSPLTTGADHDHQPAAQPVCLAAARAASCGDPHRAPAGPLRGGPRSRGATAASRWSGCIADYSKHRVTDETLTLLVELAEESGLEAAHRRHVPRREDQRHREPRRAARRAACAARSEHRSWSTARTSCPRCTRSWTRWRPSPTGCAAASGTGTPATDPERRQHRHRRLATWGR